MNISGVFYVSDSRFSRIELFKTWIVDISELSYLGLG